VSSTLGASLFRPSDGWWYNTDWSKWVYQGIKSYKERTGVAACIGLARHTSLISVSSDISFLDFYSAPLGVRSIVINPSVCLSVCLSVREHTSGTAWLIFTKFCLQIPYGRVSVLLQRRCATLCTSGFMNDVTFGRDGPYGVTWPALAPSKTSRQLNARPGGVWCLWMPCSETAKRWVGVGGVVAAGCVSAVQR